MGFLVAEMECPSPHLNIFLLYNVLNALLVHVATRFLCETEMTIL